MNKFDSNFGKVFGKAMEVNRERLVQANKAVCRLMADYLDNYILKPENILNNLQLDFASFYERREREYELE